jgi:ribonuclease R
VYKRCSPQQRGAIDFDTTETYIVCNAQGKIEQIVPRSATTRKLIEECMLAANVCAADFLKRNKHAGLYRVHAGPTPEKLENLRAFLRGMGLTLGGGEKPHASDYAALMAQIRDRPDAQMLQTDAAALDAAGRLQPGQHRPLRSRLRGVRALHEPDPPLSRSAHAPRDLRDPVGQEYTPKAPEGFELNTALSPRARDAAGRRRTRGRSATTAIWEELGLHCSANERRADESRDVEAWLKCYFMRDKLGEEYGGMVSGVTSFGIFVQLDTLFIEGLVHVTELGSTISSTTRSNELRGERTGIRYRLSDRVRVQVSRVDLDARKIDFRLVRDTPVKAPRPAPQAPAAGGNGNANANGSDRGGPRLRMLPAADEAAPRRKQAASAPTAAVKEARAARAAKKKGGAAAKTPAKKAHPRKKY